MLTTLLVAGFDSTPTPPPGMDKISTIVGWVAWIVTLVAFLVFLAGLGKIAYDALHGRETEGVKVVVIALMVTIAAGAAGVIVNTLT